MSHSPLESFVPRLLLRLLDSAWAIPRPPDDALRHSLPASLLFLDVSGFTALTDSVASRGPSGLEQLHLILNRYFASLLHTVHVHGGDLLKVAGDALVVAFHDGLDRQLTPHPAAPPAPLSPPAAGPPVLIRPASFPASLSSSPSPPAPLPAPALTAALASLAHRTVRCALALLAAPDISTAGVTLRPHIGVTSGLIHFVAVGGEPYPEAALQGAFSPLRTPLRLFHSSSPSPSPSLPPTPPGSQLRVVSAGDGDPGALYPPDLPALPPLSPLPVPLTVTVPDGGEGVGGAGYRGGSWEFLACGPAFDHLHSVVAESRTGEVVVDDETWRAVGRVAKIDGQRVALSNNWRVTACAATLSGLLPSASSARRPLPGAAGLVAGDRNGSDGEEVDGEGRGREERVVPEWLRAPSAPTRLPALSVSNFVMPVLLSRELSIGAMSTHWLGEYRRVTVLFIALPDPVRCGVGDAWLGTFHSLLRCVQHCVFRLSGQVRQLLVDDKGCTCIVAFGLPPMAHEDDAVRAVSAALAIVAAVRARHPRHAAALSLGMSTGRAWCGAVGSEGRREYAMVGDVVNASARIMAHPLTRGRVLCDEATVKACQGKVRWRAECWHIKVKGKTTTMPLYEPISRTRASASTPSHTSVNPPALQSPGPVSPSTPPVFSPTSQGPLPYLSSLSSPTPDASFRSLIRQTSSPLEASLDPLDGPRGRTLTRITSLFLDGRVSAAVAAEDTGDRPRSPPSPAVGGVSGPALPVVLLEGSAGQGKSFLVSAFTASCSLVGFEVLVGATDSIELHTPFFAFLAILQEVVERQQRLLSAQAAATGDTSLPSAVVSLLPTDMAPYCALLKPFLLVSAAAPVGAWSVSPDIAPLMRPTLTRRLIRAVISAHVAAHPHSVVVIEDAQWLDPQSWQLLQEVTELSPHVRLFLSMRPLAVTPIVSPASSPTSEGMPPSPSASLQAVRDHPRCHSFQLQSLDVADCAALASSFLQCAFIEPALARVLAERCDGVILFLQHLCAYMAERRLLAVDSATSVAFLNHDQLVVDTSLPSSLEALLTSILDCLSPDCQLAVKVSSVVGRHFACSAVSAAHPLAPGLLAVREWMENAMEQSVVEEEDDADSWDGELRTFRFSHQLLRDAAYSTLLYSQRRELHAKVAAHLRQQWELKRTVSASVQLLAHHYWLALADADDALIAQPDQPLVEAAVEFQLQAAAVSCDLGLLDAGAQFLSRAARCLRLLDDSLRRGYWQLRWLSRVLGSDVMNHPRLVVSLAIDGGDVGAGEAANFVVAGKCVRTWGLRMQGLLLEPAACAGLQALELQDLRFSTLAALWHSSVYHGREEMTAAAEVLTAFAETASGSEAGYYMMEALRAATATYWYHHNVSGLVRTFARLEQLAYYQRLLAGERVMTRYAFGYSSLARLVTDEAIFHFGCGYVKRCMAHLPRLMPLLIASGHRPSIVNGWLSLAKGVLIFGSHPTGESLVEQTITALPSAATKGNHLNYAMRCVCEMALRVWRFGDAQLVAEGSGEEPVGGCPYEEDLLALIAQLIQEGDSLGVLFHTIGHSLPTLIDCRPEVPLSVHRAMLQFARHFFARMHTRWTEMEMHRMEAAIHVRCIQRGEGDREEHAREAEELLRKARPLVSFEVLVDLKVLLTWTELRVAMGMDLDYAEAELRAALQRLPEAGEDVNSFYIARARDALRGLAGRRKADVQHHEPSNGGP